MPLLRFFQLLKSSMTDSASALFASAGLTRDTYPPTAKWPSALGARSPMKLSKFEWDTFPLNSRSFVRRGHVALLISVPSNWPVGCSGTASQKPVASEPAATLSRNTLSGLVIQYVDAVLSEGIRTSFESWPVSLKFRPSFSDPNGARFVGSQGLDVWHLVWIARLWTNWLP